jgi:hypothetical protein
MKQAAVLEAKSNEYGWTIMASPLKSKIGQHQYHLIYLPQMTFVLPTSYQSAKKFKKIEQRAIGATLCKGGFVPTFSWKVAFDPHQ